MKLREAEGQRDHLAGQVERLQRGEVERLVAGKLSMPSDLLALGRGKLGDLLDADGQADADKVEMALLGLLADRPGLAQPAPRRTGPPSHGQGGRPIEPQRPGWSDVLRGG